MPETFTSNKLRKVSLQYSNSTLSPPGSFSLFLVFLSLILCISQTELNYCFCQLPPRKIHSCLVKSQDTKKGNTFLKKIKTRRVLWLSYHILTNNHMVIFTISHKLKPSKNKQLKVYLSSFIFAKDMTFLKHPFHRRHLLARKFCKTCWKRNICFPHSGQLLLLSQQKLQFKSKHCNKAVASTTKWLKQGWIGEKNTEPILGCGHNWHFTANIMPFSPQQNSTKKKPEITSVAEKTMAPHSSTLAWKIPWMEEPGRLQSMGSLGVGHDWAASLSLFTFMHWRRKWQPTPVFLSGESQGWGSLVGCHLWHRTEPDMTEAT